MNVKTLWRRLLRRPEPLAAVEPLPALPIDDRVAVQLEKIREDMQNVQPGSFMRVSDPLMAMTATEMRMRQHLMQQQSQAEINRRLAAQQQVMMNVHNMMVNTVPASLYQSLARQRQQEIMDTLEQIRAGSPGDIILLPAGITPSALHPWLTGGFDARCRYDPTRHAAIIRKYPDWTHEDVPEPEPNPDPLLPPVDITQQMKPDCDTPDCWL